MERITTRIENINEWKDSIFESEINKLATYKAI